MKITKTYVYFGENGAVNSAVRLPGVPSITYVHLTADDGKVLTDGVQKFKNVVVMESAMEQWREIEADK